MENTVVQAKLHPINYLQPSTTQEKSFEAGPSIFGHTIQRSDLYRILRIDNGPKIDFSEVEYRLALLLLEHQGSEVSYTAIASEIYGYNLDEDLLLTIRRRVSTIRGKIADYGLDIVNISHHGYMMRELNSDLPIPYRRGSRARVKRKRRPVMR
jgi:DNA-binding response OmpR family regulator